MQAERTVVEAAEVRRRGVELYVVGVGDDVNVVELDAIASTPTSQHLVMMSSRGAAPAADTLLHWLCTAAR